MKRTIRIKAIIISILFLMNGSVYGEEWNINNATEMLAVTIHIPLRWYGERYPDLISDSREAKEFVMRFLKQNPTLFQDYKDDADFGLSRENFLFLKAFFS